MEITWLGHSCFRIKGREATVITDPCDPGSGYSVSRLQADIVTVSHPHPGHSYSEALAGDFKQIGGPGEYELKGVFITGLPSFHDSDHGARLGKNTVFVLEADGLTLCHLGDLGHLPSSDMKEKIGDIEVLFVPVGGVSTIDGSTAAEIVKQLAPKVVIPMHYKTPASTRDLEPLDKFLKESGIKEAVSRPRLSVTRSNLPASTEVVILDYPRQ